MPPEQEDKNNSKSPDQRFPSKTNSVAHNTEVYTILCVLRKMRNQLSLEAMLEYKDRYIDLIDQSNPKLKEAVEKVLSARKVEMIYKKAMS